MKKEEFEIFINSLSVGWHLKCMRENTTTLTDEQMKRFINWLERHEIKDD